jgi:hypothetical protein
MNPQDILNQNIRLLIGDLQVQLMISNARVQELEGQVAMLQETQVNPPEVSRPNGKDPKGTMPPPSEPAR